MKISHLERDVLMERSNKSLAAALYVNEKVRVSSYHYYGALIDEMTAPFIAHVSGTGFWKIPRTQDTSNMKTLVLSSELTTKAGIPPGTVFFTVHDYILDWQRPATIMQTYEWTAHINAYLWLGGQVRARDANGASVERTRLFKVPAHRVAWFARELILQAGLVNPNVQPAVPTKPAPTIDTDDTTPFTYVPANVPQVNRGEDTSNGTGIELRNLIGMVRRARGD